MRAVARERGAAHAILGAALLGGVVSLVLAPCFLATCSALPRPPTSSHGANVGNSGTTDATNVGNSCPPRLFAWSIALDDQLRPKSARLLPAGMEYLRPVGVMAQELCRHLQRCLKHDDVARQLTLRDLHLACEQWACDSLRELTEEMEMWKWDDTLGNKWARVAM